jgi:hypothetical protein
VTDKRHDDSWSAEERERKAQEEDFNRLGNAKPARTHKEVREVHPDHISSDDPSVIMQGRHRHAKHQK